MARANMAKSRANGRKKSSMVKLKFVVEKLQRSLSLAKRHASDDEGEQDDQEHGNSISSVPDDVKEGHFAVIAFDDDGHPRRFIVPLSSLTHPSFVRLLEQAAEEYGFDHEGALTIPCRSSELENILADHQHQYYSSNQQRDANNNWGASSCETMVESC